MGTLEGVKEIGVKEIVTAVIIIIISVIGVKLLPPNILRYFVLII